MKAILVTSIVLCGVFTVAHSLSCTPCNEAKCGPKPSCKGGYTKDVCGCCDVCAKVEGEHCGGYWFHFGRCDVSLKCVLRSNGQLITKGLGKFFSPGRCEKAECAVHQCGLHQTCSVVEGLPKCECPRLCKDRQKPVCGRDNGIEYLNLCYLRRYECKHGQWIPFVRGPCRYCAYQGQIYKFQEKIQKKEKCQTCSCAHGRWSCAADPTCKKTMPAMFGKPIPCVVAGIPGRDNCRRGFLCAYVNTPKGQTGICIPQSTRKARVKSTKNPTSSTTLRGTECPLRKCKPCKRGYQVDKEGCKTCRCIQMNVCGLPKFTGPCKASLPRYYFNKKSGKCSRFVFGGCKGNGNNFSTRSECKLKCRM